MTAADDIIELWRNGKKLCDVARLEEVGLDLPDIFTLQDESDSYLMWTVVEPVMDEDTGADGGDITHTIRFPGTDTFWEITLWDVPAQEGEWWCSEVIVRNEAVIPCLR